VVDMGCFGGSHLHSLGVVGYGKIAGLVDCVHALICSIGCFVVVAILHD
jgi:hypothetical protein